MSLSTKVMTLAYFGLTSPVLPRAILVPPVLLPARQRRHLPVSVLWHHLPAAVFPLTWPPSLSSTAAHLNLPGCFFSPHHSRPFSQPQHCPGPSPSSTRGAGAALLGPAHTAHGVAQRRGWGATSTKCRHGPLCSCSPPQPLLLLLEDPQQGWEEDKDRYPLPSGCWLPQEHGIAQPHQCHTSLLMQGCTRTYRKAQKTNVAQSHVCF